MVLGKKEIEKQRELAIRGLPKWEEIMRGSMKKYYLTCGNKRCRCHRSEKERHGPYWYVIVNYGVGKQKGYKIKKEEVEKVKEGIRRYEELWKGLCEIGGMNIEIMRLKRI